MAEQNFYETIYALSTPPGRGAVAVIRVSGPAALNSLHALTQRNIPQERQAQLRRLTWGDKPIDMALIVSFRAPASFTGENVVEYHAHGGWSVIQALLQALSEQKDHRQAQPGEFTRRAFEHSKLDLTEAEAIADLIDAGTEAQRLQALDQLSGSLQELYTGWTQRLTKLLALIEADIDFSDQDLPEDVVSGLHQDSLELKKEISEHLNDNRRGERLRDGFRIVILGAPNAGKSSLLNALAQREAAIVSPIAGTTRDIIELHLDIGGFPVIILDTAGLKPIQSQDPIESEGMRRALNSERDADLKLIVFDASQPQEMHILNLIDENSLVIINKTDLYVSDFDGIKLSTLTGEGFSELIQTIIGHLTALVGHKQSPTLTRTRHRQSLLETVRALERAYDGSLPELVAEDLRLALRSLGAITGTVDVEDLLDAIFRDFCIGK